MKNPGTLIQLSDGRKCIVYNKQPLFAEKGKVILHLLDEDLKLIPDEKNNPKIIMKDVTVYNEEMQAAKLIGYVD
jgi:hypothetical protein